MSAAALDVVHGDPQSGVDFIGTDNAPRPHPPRAGLPPRESRASSSVSREIGPVLRLRVPTHVPFPGRQVGQRSPNRAAGGILSSVDVSTKQLQASQARLANRAARISFARNLTSCHAPSAPSNCSLPRPKRAASAVGPAGHKNSLRVRLLAAKRCRKGAPVCDCVVTTAGLDPR